MIISNDNEGADHVFQVFREIGTPVTKLFWTAIMMLIVFCVGAVLVVPSLLILIALPFPPGAILSKAFRDDVIPACRNLCSEKRIVAGALKSLRYLWAHYLLGLLPGIVIVIGLAPAYYSSEMMELKPFRELGMPIMMSFATILLGDFALAVFPVARLFNRRAGTIVMLILIILGQAVLLATAMYGASGIIWFTDGTPPVGKYTVFTFCLIFVCAVVFVGGLGYFIRAAYTGAEEDGLPDTDNEPQPLHQQHHEKTASMSSKKTSRNIVFAVVAVFLAVAVFTWCRTSTENAITLRSAAEQGDLEAQYQLGLSLYRKGLEAEGVEWLLKAAEQGYAPAQYSIGTCYLNGVGVKRDMARCVEWIRKAAEQDEPHSQNLLAECYAGGNGVEKDMAEAVKWLRKAGENGLIRAQFQLGCYYLNGGVEGYEPDGLTLLGLPGVKNPDGKGIDKDVIDPPEGAKWFRKIAERAEADVHVNERDRYIEAQHNLGVLYSRGEGVEKDLTEARKWYRKAAAQGYEKSKAALKRLGAE